MKIVEKDRTVNEPLRVLDFAKDLVPGMPRNAFFTESLNRSQYTCMVVSR